MSDRLYVGLRRRMTVQDWLSLGWDRAQAERHERLGRTIAEVVVLDASGARPLRHFVRHSPNGFDWGYRG